jgi:hypothetical protein
MSLGLRMCLAACAAVTIANTSGCDSRRPLESRGAPPASLGLAPPPPPASHRFDAGLAEPSRRPRRSAPSGSSPTPSPGANTDAVEATDAAGSVSGPFIIDGLVDVAAAGPVTATERGIVMYDRENRLQLARLATPLDAGSAPVETRISVLPDQAGPFSLARGPAVRRGLAYWVSRGRLIGQSLGSAGTPAAIVLREDARTGTRAAVPIGAPDLLRALPQMAAYIARPDKPDAPPTARLWVEGQPTSLGLTDDLASSHSVALAATPAGLSVMFLEARTGMSSIHLRQITLSKKNEPSLGPDQIAWVGGPARSTTELFVLPDAEPRLKGFMTLEQDITHFGLVGLDVSLEKGADLPVEPEWLAYANGIEPAPFALADVCGHAVVALARPSSPVPHAPQELVLIDIARKPRFAPAVLARSRAFFDISLVGLTGGGLLGFVADHRTWARSIRCLRR